MLLLCGLYYLSITFSRATLLDPVLGSFTVPVGMSRLCAVEAQILLAELSTFRRTFGRLDAIKLEVLIFSDPLFIRSLLNLGG